jgi:putative toxin-antitoxin system antitoxin component (TIGR02293 family)
MSVSPLQSFQSQVVAELHDDLERLVEVVDATKDDRGIRWSEEGMIDVIHEGLPHRSFEAIQADLGLTKEEVGRLVHISPRTASRRQQIGHFKVDESERILRIVRIWIRAAVIFRDADEAREWLKEPNYALGGKTPLSYADTEPGARIVEDLLGRIEHGLPV